jgi:hypothetical protein
MKSKKTPRDMQRKTTSFDFGSYSTKVFSDDSRGSFLSLAANVPTDMRQPISDPDTHDLDILETPRNMTGRWIVGKQATYYEHVERFTRSMRRYADKLYDVFVCAALRAAFPTRHRPQSVIKENRGVLNDNWHWPVYSVISIAPGYYKGNAEEMINNIKGDYSFIDRQTGNLYMFRIERVLVVFEGWGIYSAKIYGQDESGQIIIQPGAAKYVRSTVAIFDAGGRTTDVAVWREGKPDERMIGSGDEGIILTAEKIVKDVMSVDAEYFPNQPDVLDIIKAMEERTKQGVIMIGANGKRVNITEQVDANMLHYASRAMEIYENTLRSGQGIEALIYGGGAIRILKPYLDQAIQFERTFLVSNKAKGMYMANAEFTYYYAVHKQAQEQG